MTTETVRTEHSRRPGQWTKYTLSRPREDKVDNYIVEIDLRDGVLHVEARIATVSYGGRKVTISAPLNPAVLADDIRSALIAAMSPDHAALTLAAVAAYMPPEPEPLPAASLPAAQERAIAADHAADVANGLSEADADESDDFERRVLGLD